MLTIICTLLLSILLLSSIRKNNLKSFPNCYSSFSSAYFLYYILVPFIIFVLREFSPKSNKYFGEFMGNGGLEPLFYYSFVAIFFIVFNTAYNSKPKHVYSFNEKRFLRYMKQVGWITLIVGGVSLIAYFYYLGGFVSALAIAEYARAFGDMTSVLSGWQIMLLTPARLLSLPAFCFFFLYEKYGGSKYFWACLLSIVLLFLLYLFEASRTSLVTLLLVLGMPVLRKFTKRPWTIIILVAAVGINMLNILDMVFASYSSGEYDVSSFDINELLCQFSFASRNAMYSLDIVSKYGCRFGHDFISAFINYIPGVAIEGSTMPTSRYWGGDDFMAGVPNDVITFSILEFHIIGLVLYSYILGKLIRRVDIALINLSKIESYKYSFQLFLTMLMLALFFYIPSADIESVLMHYSLLVFFYILLRSNKKLVIQ